MRARLALRSSRRSFLKLGAAAVAAAVAGALDLRLSQPPLSAPGVSGLRLASALPRPGWPLLSDPEQLLQTPAANLDAALVPAYVAAMLIQAGRLQPLHGPAGRPHDPEGRYTVPFAYRVAALRYPSEAATPQMASWADLLPGTSSGAWPTWAFARVITGAALLRRGFSPNDTHPGHLAQAAGDLASWHPRVAPELAGPLQTKPAPALVLVDPADLSPADRLRLPAEGTLLIEYDWVITAAPAHAAAARQLIAGLPAATPIWRSDLSPRLIPLMPLPPAARAQHTAIWNELADRWPAFVA